MGGDVERVVDVDGDVDPVHAVGAAVRDGVVLALGHALSDVELAGVHGAVVKVVAVQDFVDAEAVADQALT